MAAIDGYLWVVLYSWVATGAAVWIVSAVWDLCALDRSITDQSRRSRRDPEPPSPAHAPLPTAVAKTRKKRETL